MNKANVVSEWIKSQKNARKKNFELAKILGCSKSSISNLKYKRHQMGDLTKKAFEIIKKMEIDELSKYAKTDWPKGIAVISETDVKIKELFDIAREHAVKLNGLKNTPESLHILAKKIDDFKNEIREKIGRVNMRLDYLDNKPVVIPNQINMDMVVNEIHYQLKTIKEFDVNELKSETVNTRNHSEKVLSDLNILSDSIDESLKELTDRITALQERDWQPKTGLIRKFWRWLC